MEKLQINDYCVNVKKIIGHAENTLLKVRHINQNGEISLTRGGFFSKKESLRKATKLERLFPLNLELPHNYIDKLQRKIEEDCELMLIFFKGEEIELIIPFDLLNFEIKLNLIENIDLLSCSFGISLKTQYEFICPKTKEQKSDFLKNRIDSVGKVNSILGPIITEADIANVYKGRP